MHEKLYYIRFDGTGVCVEECPTVTNFDRLWGCTDEFSSFTAAEDYDCAANPSECATKADVDPTGEDGGFGGGGMGVCMYQVESMDCEFRLLGCPRSLQLLVCNFSAVHTVSTVDFLSH